MKRLEMWKSRGRGGLTGRWTSSSCHPGRSRSCHSPTAGLHPCRPAGPTISGCPEAYCTSLMIELLSPWGRCRFSHENLTSSQTSSSCCPEIFKFWCTNTWPTLKKYILSLPPHRKAASTESGIPGKPFSIGPGYPSWEKIFNIGQTPFCPSPPFPYFWTSSNCCPDNEELPFWKFCILIQSHLEEVSVIVQHKRCINIVRKTPILSYPSKVMTFIWMISVFVTSLDILLLLLYLGWWDANTEKRQIWGLDKHFVTLSPWKT